jgi:hypothetical protein
LEEVQEMIAKKTPTKKAAKASMQSYHRKETGSKKSSC